MAGRVLFVAPGVPVENVALRSLADAARAEGIGFDMLAVPATESALRARLTAGDIELLVYLGRGQARQADHVTIELASSSGPEPRAVNLRHVAALLAAAPALQGVLLVPRDGASFAGFAGRLVAHGAPAAMVWSERFDAGAARRWWRAWRDGMDWPTLARLDAAVLEHAVRPAATTASAGEGQRAAAPVHAPPAAALTDILPEEGITERLLDAKRAEGRFDVFLCHNGADKPAVRAIARALRARGLLPWLDEWELPPGQPWQPLLEQQIEHIGSAAVFVGLAGVGPWQEQEIYGFLREFVARRAPVIPVLLDNAPSAPDLPVFLRAMTYVDFRLREPDPMQRLEWGVTGVRPDYA
jgi:hypothetical protein